MTNKQSFTPEEWNKLLESMMLAGMAVSVADPNGWWGEIKEAFASRSAIGSSARQSNELIRAVIAELEIAEGRSVIQEALRKRVAGAQPAEIVQRSLDNLREVSAILDASSMCSLARRLIRTNARITKRLTSMARVEFRTMAAMIAPCSVKA